MLRLFRSKICKKWKTFQTAQFCLCLRIDSSGKCKWNSGKIVVGMKQTTSCTKFSDHKWRLRYYNLYSSNNASFQLKRCNFSMKNPTTTVPLKTFMEMSKETTMQWSNGEKQWSQYQMTYLLWYQINTLMQNIMVNNWNYKQNWTLKMLLRGKIKLRPFTEMY